MISSNHSPEGLSSSHTPPLRGIVPPLVTPLAGPDELDVPGIERLIEHVLAGGVHGLFVLGTTGEGPSLSHRLQREVVRRACDIVGRRVPILVGITDTSFVESVALAEAAADAGATYVVLAPPYYFAPGQPELMEYIEHLVAKLPLPVFLYNMPGLTKVNIDPSTARRAADLPGVVGLKDSSGDMMLFHRYRRALQDRPGFSLFVGPEQLLAESVLMGGHGGVCGGANVFPRLFVALYEAATAGDLPRMRTLQAKVMELDATLYGIGRHGSSFLKGVKASLSCLGVCDDFLSEPMHRFRQPERERVMECLERVAAWPEAGETASLLARAGCSGCAGP